MDEKKAYSPKDLEHFRKIIVEQMRDTKEIIDHKLNNSLKSVSVESGDTHHDEMGTENNARELDFFIAERESGFVVNLEFALKRIDNGTYGQCRTCGNLISKKRLEIVPHATLCIECKNNKERKD
ncbi:MAG: TraR/DksA C4-type zinc finger protein [Candidatus Delongbacteria bacterium]|nr:TraR/DksA C4-type zinc finger protein [Candidatus Delongbacteria bacterium]MBN2835042.1 TraR/DksA C4-type zinc finger protein [Candidatus Delongbacteria bacterium]